MQQFIEGLIETGLGVSLGLSQGKRTRNQESSPGFGSQTTCERTTTLNCGSLSAVYNQGKSPACCLEEGNSCTGKEGVFRL